MLAYRLSYETLDNSAINHGAIPLVEILPSLTGSQAHAVSGAPYVGI